MLKAHLGKLPPSLSWQEANQRNLFYIIAKPKAVVVLWVQMRNIAVLSPKEIAQLANRGAVEPLEVLNIF